MSVDEILQNVRELRSQAYNSKIEWNKKQVDFYTYKHVQLVSARSILDNFIELCKIIGVKWEIYHYYELAGID